ncbi:hypothetical protein MVEN_01089600 [Mycena venus]|uniref:Zn(2)-C6 fungal-type domain-containing protein n=1 Tax=Mycena venus TaxID=2733690 RepID=A0A8H7D0B7_9AGAR|nr:hypothetical protein MVEN_01089600 [Mycena venus]
MHRTTKRAKTIQACASCRKHKTRCEILDHSASPVRCHRCKVLSVECSYEQTQKPATSQPPPKPPNVMAESISPDANQRPRLDTLAPSHRLWSFVDGQNVDWSAPMLAIQHLTTLSAVDSTPVEFVNNDLSLSMILPEGRIDYLIDLFNAQYTPWLNFQPMRNSKNPLVDIACSAVAARHLDGVAGKEVRLRLQNLTRESIAQMVFKPGATESVEAVQCLLILSLWGPFGAAPEIHEWDTEALVATAVRMAKNLRLDHASTVVNDIREQENPNATNIAEACERARLWIALTNAESMLCLGTRRTPSSRRSPDDNTLIQFPPVLNAQTDLRDLRLGLSARPLDLFEEGVAISLGADKEEWALEMKRVLERIKREKRLLMPLPVVMDADQFYFHVLHILHGSCRLLALYHAFWEARISGPLVVPGQAWHEQFMPRGAREALISILARDMLQTSEALLVSFLAAPTTRLCTAPDTYFNMVALAAGFLVGVKFLVVRRTHGRTLAGASDLLLARTVAGLHRAACGTGHAAHRCALLVQNMLAKWHARDHSTETPPQQTYSISPATGLGVQQQVDVSPGQSPQSSLHMPSSPPQLPAEQETNPFLDVEFMFLNSMLGDDSAFWETLVQDQLTW